MCHRSRTCIRRYPAIGLENAHPVTDFNRNSTEYVRRLNETEEPELLTVDGEAHIVVQSATAYQKLLDAVELSETLPILRKSLAEAKRGEGRPAADVFKEIAATVGLDLDR